MVKSNKPVWHEADMATVEKELEFLDDYGQSEEIPRLELEFGDTRIRVLPPYSDRGRWYNKYGMHWNLTIPGDRTTFRCAQMQDDPQECLFCIGAEEYRSSNPDLYRKWRAKARYDFNVINLDEPELGVLLMSLPPTAAEKIFEVANRWGDPTHPENGYGFTVTKKKTGAKAYDVEYSVLADRESSELEDWSVLENLHLLDEIFPAPSLQEQQKVLQLDTGVSSGRNLLVGAEEDVIQGVVVQEEEEPIEEEVVLQKSPGELLQERISQRQ